MSDRIKHECGIAFIRLLKPLSYYKEKYDSNLYALDKLYLLMEKQRNRGQDGAGVATVKLDVPPGKRYISRYRSNAHEPTQEIFNKIHNRIEESIKDDHSRINDSEWLKNNVPFVGEVLMGHLRYGTHGKNSIEACHPFLRQNNWKTRNLVLAGNFNMTNVEELFQHLVELGQFPKEKSDTVTVLEKIGHFLDMENQNLFDECQAKNMSKEEITSYIEENIYIKRILQRASKDFDGGYAMVGLMGHGDAFILRDPAGIRPAYYYHDDEIVVAASERSAIQTVFDLQIESIKEVTPGHALIIKKSGKVREKKCNEPTEKKSCSFERIYFSRGNDADIYSERKALGRLLAPKILETIDYDIKNTVFSFIPNTAETSFYGLQEGIRQYFNDHVRRKMEEGLQGTEALEALFSQKPRFEKIAIKDAKFRTFITDDSSRDDIVTHAYDVTYGVVKKTDTLVVIDDSIVRGTTLKQSIIRILDRLNPKRIIVVSSAPQIRYPDCYGIDMSMMKDFAAFRATLALLKETKQENIIDDVYDQCKAQVNNSKHDTFNAVKAFYKPFTQQQISDKIAEMLKPKDTNAEVKIIFQDIETLHKACPNHLGDWYFTGNYPTPGGNVVVNKAFLNFMEGKNVRAY